MRMPAFRSSLAQAMNDLVTFKRMEGFDYTAQAVFLGYFDSFLCTQDYRQATLNRQIVDAYIAHTCNQAANCRYSRLSSVRVLSRYLHQYDPESYVLRELPVRRPTLPRWYLYSTDEITALMQHARSLRPVGSLRPHCFQMLVGLLSVTGLRIGEALSLNLGDIDTSRGLVLIRKGKFGKERYVALHSTTMEAVQAYLAKRAHYEPTGESAPVFLNSSGRRLEYRQAAATFRGMVRRCNVGQNAPQLPRLHDLRHTYASRCLLEWYKQGGDVNDKLPILATAMGHVNVEATQIYLHVTSSLLEEAAQRFHAAFIESCKGE